MCLSLGKQKLHPKSKKLSYNKIVKKITCILLTFIITAFSMLSVSASPLTCQHSHPDSMNSNVKVAIHDSMQTTMHMQMDMKDCHDLLSSNSSVCDCDHGQASYSALSNESNVQLRNRKTTLNSIFQDLILAFIPDSLHRPPITHHA